MPSFILKNERSSEVKPFIERYSTFMITLSKSSYGYSGQLPFRLLSIPSLTARRRRCTSFCLSSIFLFMSFRYYFLHLIFIFSLLEATALRINCLSSYTDIVYTFSFLDSYYYRRPLIYLFLPSNWHTSPALLLSLSTLHT
jgi:hypothetical protein